MNAVQIATEVAAGRLDAERVVGEALERLTAQPELNAVITVCADEALARARAGPRGRLAGVPLLVKDLIDTAGVRTTYASAIHRDHVPRVTAPAVAALEAEGAIVVGKANADEFAWGVCGQNVHWGDMGNPRHPGCIAGGSSGGASQTTSPLGANAAEALRHLAGVALHQPHAVRGHVEGGRDHLREHRLVRLAGAGRAGPRDVRPVRERLDRAVLGAARVGSGPLDVAGHTDAQQWIDSGELPDVVMACAGDVATLESLAATAILRERLPALRVRVVNVVDLMRLEPDTEHPHGLPDAQFDALFTADRPVVFARHGYPSLIHRLTYRRANHANLHVRGYQEEGTTTTPFDLVMMNDLDRFHLVIDVIDRVPSLRGRAAHLRQEMVDARGQARAYTREHGEDPPEIADWTWPA